MFSSLKKMFSGGEKEREKILAPVEGKAVPLSEVSDPTFSQEYWERVLPSFRKREESWLRPAVF